MMASLSMILAVAGMCSLICTPEALVLIGLNWPPVGALAHPATVCLLMLQNEFVGVEHDPEHVLSRFEAVAPVVLPGHFGDFLLRGRWRTSERRHIQVADLVLDLRVGRRAVKQRASFAANRLLDQLAAPHHQGLRNGAVEGGGLVILVRAEGH